MNAPATALRAARPALVTIAATIPCVAVGSYWLGLGVALAFLAGVYCTTRGWLTRTRP